jgi:hypothetical protein
MVLTRKVLVPVLLIIALAGCTDSTRPPNPRPPDPLAERVLPPPWADDVASGTFGFPLSVADAERILTRTKIFALGEMPPKRQVQAFNLLLDQADALVRFRRIAVEGGHAGRLYALAALTMLAPSEAADFARKLSDEDDEILVYDSDVVRHSQLREVVSLIRQRHVGEECRKLRESTHDYFQKLANTPLQPTSGTGPSS